jgi:uncharacterized protein
MPVRYAALAAAGALVLGLLPALAQSPLEAPGPQGPLKGTLLAPAKVDAAVVIIPGSGPTDRDGNSPLGVKASTLRLLAEGLSANGIASVRIDKRGMFASAGAVPDANAVTIADYADDAVAWLAVTRATLGLPCVWLMGHSEGGLVASVAARRSPDACGLILMAAAGRPLGQILRAQLRANPANGPILPQALAAIDQLEAGKRVDVTGMHLILSTTLFAPAVQGFLISTMAIDPPSLLRDYDKPILILQGARDLQTTVSDAELLKAANANARVVIVPGANHVLKRVTTEERSTNFATYADPNLPLAPGIVETLIDFLRTTAVNK